MSMTTENSLQRNGSRFLWCQGLFRFGWCPCFRRKVAPVNPVPSDSDFMTLGRKGKRVICVVHIDPSLSCDILTKKDSSLAAFAKKVVCDDKGYESDSSNEEYWFSKWSRPLRTVKRFQAEHLQKQNIIGLIKNHLPAAEKTPKSENSSTTTDLKVVSTFAVEQSSQIIKEASREFSNKNTATTCLDLSQTGSDSAQVEKKDGVVNLAFEGSPSDPGASIVTANDFKQQNVTKPLLYFIHGAGESSECWKVLMHHFAGLGYEVLAIDLLGHGFSHTPLVEKSYTFKKLLGDVISVFDAHISNGRKCALIGHGYGCSFAVALSRQRSANVTLLALLSSGGPTPLAPPVNWRREWKLPASMLHCLRSILPCGMRRNVFYGPRGKSCLHDTIYFQSLPSYVRHHLAVGQTWPEGDVAFHRKIVMPTLLVHGLKDPFVSLVEMCEMERTIPRAFLEVIPESGHDIMSDVPNQLCKMLRKFFEHWQR
ncbi:uncharacterized protein LOC130689664 [Daphnia carinata]|uniref:uncharacterized protein LOC130689664 n=1 Tax=Daphnia carinata TaxID=120202 RepID=UPI00257F0017|nr:uncharacterized protein LOC130689664 [Daphnia carinata]